MTSVLILLGAMCLLLALSIRMGHVIDRQRKRRAIVLVLSASFENVTNAFRQLAVAFEQMAPVVKKAAEAMNKFGQTITKDENENH